MIEKSQSDWALPVVIVRKEDNSNSFCIDYRKLNRIALKDSYPMPLIEENLECLKGRKFFTSLDLISGYWQIIIDPAARKTHSVRLP